MLREVELQDNADDAALLSGGARDPRGVPLFRDSADGAVHSGAPNAAATSATGVKHGRFGAVLAALAAEPLLLKTVAGVLLGIVVGSIARAANPTPRAVELIGFPGELFMRMLRALVLPLVSVSMVSGVCSLSARSAGSAKRVATRLVTCYFVSTLIACALGLAVVSVVRPGVGVSIDGAACDHARRSSAAAASPSSSASPVVGGGDGEPPAATGAPDADTGASSSSSPSATAAEEAHRGALDSMLGTARAAVPANIVAAAAEGNILGVISASLLFGAALAAAGPDKADPLVRVVNSLNHVIEVMVGWAIALMPPGGEHPKKKKTRPAPRTEPSAPHFLTLLSLVSRTSGIIVS